MESKNITSSLNVCKTDIWYKTDDNTIINKNHIRWIKKINDCLEVCTKSIGCDINQGNTHRICKQNNIESYTRLNQYFS